MMNNLLQTLIISLSVALFLSISDASSSSSSSSENDIAGFKTQDEEAVALDKVVGVRRLLVQQKIMGGSYYYNMTCDKFPGVCRLRSNGLGSDCCKNKCVNVKSDKMNCGKCGYKCKYTEICCEGKCVNASFETRNCGGCNKKCNKGELCVYGMCNYA